MKVSSDNYGIQTNGLYIGRPHYKIACAFDNIDTSFVPESVYELNDKELKENIKKYKKKTLHRVSFEGGEPLLQIDNLKTVCKGLDVPVHVKSNGSLPNYLLELVEQVASLELVYRPGYDDAFLESVSISQFIKDVAVIYPFLTVDRDCLSKVADFVSTVDPDILFILQPKMKYTSKHSSSDADIVKAFNFARQSLRNVQIVPDLNNLYQGIFI